MLIESVSQIDLNQFFPSSIHFLQLWHKIQLPAFADSLLRCTTGPIAFLFHPIFHTTFEHHLRFSCIHLQTFGFQLRIPLYYLLM